MENTQMPSAGVPQVPQQEVNPTPPTSSPEPVISPTPKKGGGLIKILVGVFAIAILGFGGWYAYDSGLFTGESDDTPPSLSIGGSGFQGKSVETTFGFLQYDTADITAFSDAGKNLKPVLKGVNYFAPLRNTSFEEIEASIKPVDNLKILIAYYDKAEPWAGDTSKNGCFKVYPVGPYDKTCEVAENNLGTVTVSKNTSIAIISSADYEIDSGLLADAKTLTDTLILTGPNGWSMHPLASNMDLSDTRITNLWVQKNANEFEKVTDTANLDVSREYKMAWFKLGDPVVAGDATGGGDSTPAPAVCGDGNVDSGEACDDGTNNSDTVANACRTTCVVADCGDGVVDAGEECDGAADCEADCTLTVVEPVCGDDVVDAGEECDGTADCEADCTLTIAGPVCGDGVVDAGEECDGTADCEADCTLTAVVTEICGNNIIDGTDVCDGTDLGGKNCINYVAGSTFSEGTLGCATDCSAYDTSACATGAASGGTVETAPTTTFADDTINTNIGISADRVMITVPVNTTRTIAPTATGNAYVEHVQYIDNIENEFPGLTLPANIRGQLYTSKNDGTYLSYIPVTAIEVKAGGSTGNIKLNLARFYSTGYTQDSTNAQLEYCDGAGDWEFYRIQESANGGINDQVVFSLKENMTTERGSYTFEDSSEYSYNPTEATINAGESAVFFLLMEDMSACHDESNDAGTSWSQTDITKLIFTEGDLNKKTYLKSDILHNALDRNIYWE